jgi:hypothetical protein
MCVMVDHYELDDNAPFEFLNSLQTWFKEYGENFQSIEFNGFAFKIMEMRPHEFLAKLISTGLFSVQNKFDGSYLVHLVHDVPKTIEDYQQFVRYWQL